MKVEELGRGPLAELTGTTVTLWLGWMSVASRDCLPALTSPSFISDWQALLGVPAANPSLIFRHLRRGHCSDLESFGQLPQPS